MHRTRQYLLELHDNICIGVAEVIRGAARARPRLLCLIIHAAQLLQQALLLVQSSSDLHPHDAMTASA